MVNREIKSQLLSNVSIKICWTLDSSLVKRNVWVPTHPGVPRILRSEKYFGTIGQFLLWTSRTTDLFSLNTFWATHSFSLNFRTTDLYPLFSVVKWRVFVFWVFNCVERQQMTAIVFNFIVLIQLELHYIISLIQLISWKRVMAAKLIN